MKLIDIDKLEALKTHIHYIKIYKASAIFMDNDSKIKRYGVEFTVEYKPVGAPDIKIKFEDPEHFPNINIIDKMKKKIYEMDCKGVLV